MIDCVPLMKHVLSRLCDPHPSIKDKNEHESDAREHNDDDDDDGGLAVDIIL